jgi:hypothetical protein
MANSNGKDLTDTQRYRYGPENQRLSQLNIHRWASGVRGYPSDPEYMKQVSKAGLERDTTRLHEEATGMERRYQQNMKNRKKR